MAQAANVIHSFVAGASVEAATETEIFRLFVREALVPALRRGCEGDLLERYSSPARCYDLSCHGWASASGTHR